MALGLRGDATAFPLLFRFLVNVKSFLSWLVENLQQCFTCFFVSHPLCLSNRLPKHTLYGLPETYTRTISTGIHDNALENNRGITMLRKQVPLDVKQHGKERTPLEEARRAEFAVALVCPHTAKRHGTKVLLSNTVGYVEICCLGRGRIISRVCFALLRAKKCEMARSVLLYSSAVRSRPRHFLIIAFPSFLRCCLQCHGVRPPPTATILAAPSQDI
jgi:hypothetical protein